MKEQPMSGANELDYLMRREEYFPARCVDKEKVFVGSESERKGVGVLPRLRLPAKSIDEWPTLVGLPVAPRCIVEVMGVSRVVGDDAVVGSPLLDGLTIDQQITWGLPAIPVVISTPKSETKASTGGCSPPIDRGGRTLIRHLAKDSAIYALPSFVGPLITLVLAPFLTHALSHAEYGMLAVLMTAVALMAGITQFGLNFACIRACSYEFECEADRRTAISTMTVLVTLFAVSAAAILVLAAPTLSLLLFCSRLACPGGLFGDEIRLAAMVLLMQNLMLPGLTWLRVEGRAVYFSVVSVTSVLINLGVTLLLVGVFSMGLVGVLLATGGGYAWIVVCTLPVMVIRVGLRLRRDVARNLLGFGVPLVANFVSTWVLQLSDRYVLGRMSSLDVVASYSVAYTLGSALAIIITPFLLAWSPVMYSIAKRDDARRVYQLVFRSFSLVLLFATYGLSLVSSNVLYMFFPPDYSATGPVIPIVAVSIMFSGVYNFFNVGISIRRKTWYAVLFTTLAAVVNVGMNVLLIPVYGAMGAAISTLVAYALLAFVAYIVNQRIYWIPFEIGRFGVALFIGVVLYTSSSVLMQKQGLFLADAVGFCTLLLYGGGLVLLGVAPRLIGGREEGMLMLPS